MTTRATGRVHIREAERADNAALLALTASSPMGGRIGVRIDRAPDFFGLLDRRGPGVVLAAEHGGNLVGSLSAALMTLHVNGAPERIWFLGDFKVATPYRGSGLAVRLLRAMRVRLRDDGPDLVVGLTARDNHFVQPFHGGRARLPNSASLGAFRVLQMLPTRRTPALNAYDVDEFADGGILQSRYDAWASGYQFGPVVTSHYLAGARHLVATDRRGAIAGCMALADVSDVRQNVLVRLPWPLRVASSALRQGSRVLPIVRPPMVGQPIRTLYVKALGVNGNHQEALHALIGRARFLAATGGYHFLSVGLHERDPLLRRFRRVPAFSFDVTGFVVSLRRDATALAHLLERVPFQDFSVA